MVRIESIRARGLSVPLDQVTSLASRRVTERHYGVVEIECDDGHKGIGFCYVGSAGAGLFPEAIALLAPVLIGQDPYRVEGLWQEMYQEVLLQGRAGTVMRAISALDIALWDHNARAANLPLHRFLGSVTSTRVPAYASGGYFIDGKTPQHLADEMEGFVKQGFSAVKIKVGKGNTVGEEEARIAAVRERIGPDILLMLDANNAWRDVPTALRFARMYEKYDPYFLEEPFSPDDIENHASLAQRTSILIATGEIEAGRWRFKELLDKQGAAILQTDACVCGGVTEFRRIAATAASYGVTISPHWFHDLHAHLVAATPNCRFIEFFPDSQVLNFRKLVDRQLVVDRGDIVLPQLPGLGFDFIPQTLETYGSTPWFESRLQRPKVAALHAVEGIAQS
ncbi:mandelate racemase/muconate lactonizing enzyme family protein [uncultured Devosia sp.]|uniref:mandelate racemase/muconate lactonizing enzyme family protein n=1 Tax=uncultured Devosia sp. TaxID=211434 RepID=UPI0035CAF423